MVLPPVVASMGTGTKHVVNFVQEGCGMFVGTTERVIKKTEPVNATSDGTDVLKTLHLQIHLSLHPQCPVLCALTVGKARIVQ